MLVENYSEGHSPAASAGELIPRQTIESIVRQRNLVVERFGDSWRKLEASRLSLEDAWAAVKVLRPSENRMNYHLTSEKSRTDRAEFLGVIRLQSLDNYMADARRIADTEAWAHVIEITDLQRLMDKKAKTELFQQLLTTPPEATVENIQATLQQFMLDADTIFRRGIANCFSALDRRFKSHDGFKIGRRIILDHMYTEHGSLNFHRDMESTMMDIERTFLVLDGRKVTDAYSGIVGQMRENRSNYRGGGGVLPGQVESEFFRVNIFKNGNAHIWFKRDDLVVKVNQLLAEYYGATIPDGMEAEDDGGLYVPKTELAKNSGWFPTPDKVTARIVEVVPLLRPREESRLEILEPSAGMGALALACLLKPSADAPKLDEWSRTRAKSFDAQYRYDNVVDCVEIDDSRVRALLQLHSDRGCFRHIVQADFLAMRPQRFYDRIVMNPPFDRERDIDHVIHAMGFLKPNGFLCAVMSAGTEFRETRKSTSFRKLMNQKNARFEDLPAGSFASSGTYVNTIIVYFWNTGQTVYSGRKFE